MSMCAYLFVLYSCCLSMFVMSGQVSSKMWNFLLVLSRIVMSGLRFVISISGGMVPPPAASCPGISLCTENFCVSSMGRKAMLYLWHASPAPLTFLWKVWLRACPAVVAAPTTVAAWQGLTTVTFSAASLPPTQCGSSTPARLSCSCSLSTLAPSCLWGTPTSSSSLVFCKGGCQSFQEPWREDFGVILVNISRRPRQRGWLVRTEAA